MLFFFFQLPKAFKNCMHVLERLNIYDPLWCYRRKINPITQNKRGRYLKGDALLSPILSAVQISACHKG